jgi:excisionase family DNA binding protein
MRDLSVHANHMRVQDIVDMLNRERQEALAVRDPIAIAVAAERYNTLTAALAEFPNEDMLDLYRPVLSVSQAAKLLGYNAKEVRRLLGQGKLSGKKVNNQWRIPLKAVL